MSGRMVIRDAVEADMRTIRSQWLSRELPRGKEVRGGEVAMGRPHHGLTLPLARRALTMLVDSLLGESTILVAELDSVPGEILGWIVFTDEAVLYVCVPSGYGRRGIAMLLVQRAGVVLPFWWATPGGRRLRQKLEADPEDH